MNLKYAIAYRVNTDLPARQEVDSKSKDQSAAPASPIVEASPYLIGPVRPTRSISIARLATILGLGSLAWAAIVWAVVSVL